MANKPPSRWSEYCEMHEVIEGTRFLPFKTPFKRAVLNPKNSIRESFNAIDLLRKVGNLGLVLNLVKTDRYYNAALYGSKKVEYHHVRLTGGGRVPSGDEIADVFRRLDRFILRNKDDPAKLIGVHCTHGVNRTGYIICRYMICKLGFEPDEAIRRFEKGRRHRFDHEEYVEALRTLRPAVDDSAREWHSVGGRIISGEEESEDDFDPDELERLARKRKSSSSERSANHRDSNGGFSTAGAKRRGREDADRPRRPWSSSSSSRSRRDDRSRSPVRISRRDGGDHRSYGDRSSQGAESNDRLWPYTGHRTPGGRFNAPEYLGPRHEDWRRRY
ncbi:RNA/RNP complex-1-interacting phosphatase homolog [Galendromus occidentalis]|uniref:RNA/RNP complex-1-interacting phosphatase homolog n=1 Tax=Galendromus occidentalis TaxID=34638 RepID=A0AAJ6W0H5_9ACAR|nr:RNA/RNP complex-1-interacting phosphatase homolog [Galendromus occidentalis]